MKGGTLNVLDLFSGFGTTQYVSILLGGEWRVIGHVDFSNYCCELIRQRIENNEYQPANIHCMDVREFIESGVIEAYQGITDCITAGPPCQSFSVAGKQKGETDERNGFPLLFECCRRIRPRFVFVENSPNLANFDYFHEILGTFSEIGYDAKWDVFSAAAQGANQLRKRLWILAVLNEQGLPSDRSSGYGNGETVGERGEDPDIIQETAGTGINDSPDKIRCNEGSEYSGREKGIEFVGSDKNSLSNNEGIGMEGMRSEGKQESDLQKGQKLSGCDNNRIIPHWWDRDPADDVESRLVRLVYGVPNRRERIEALGNAWVPAVAANAWCILIKD